MEKEKHAEQSDKFSKISKLLESITVEQIQEKEKEKEKGKGKEMLGELTELLSDLKKTLPHLGKIFKKGRKLYVLVPSKTAPPDLKQKNDEEIRKLVKDYFDARSNRGWKHAILENIKHRIGEMILPKSFLDEKTKIFENPYIEDAETSLRSAGYKLDRTNSSYTGKKDEISMEELALILLHLGIRELYNVESILPNINLSKN